MKRRKAIKCFEKELKRLKKLHVAQLMQNKSYHDLRRIMSAKMADLRDTKLREYLTQNCLLLEAEEIKADLREVLFLICCLNLNDSSFFTQEEREVIGDILTNSTSYSKTGKFIYVGTDFKELSIRRLLDVTSYL